MWSPTYEQQTAIKNNYLKRLFSARAGGTLLIKNNNSYRLDFLRNIVKSIFNKQSINYKDNIDKKYQNAF